MITVGSPEASVHILVVDCYDSFTFNIVQALAMLGARCDVVYCDEITSSQVPTLAPDGIVLSPGPCTPDDAGATLNILRDHSDRIAMLGVCLGHQAIAQAFGGRVTVADRALHGKTSIIEHDEKTIFEGIPQAFVAARYNSLVVLPESLPACLHISAWTPEGEIMAVRHRTRPIEGVQFHPESILSEQGRALFSNWLRRVAAHRLHER
ncbi:MAG: aminodeoxychorismate/anthranilate synthase component II [Polyangiaceae bacterium]|nr:aminodeoxychorismate/anthranilate synthase component II [Polyangiaceae bacterium]